jgi:hypothetical protein
VRGTEREGGREEEVVVEEGHCGSNVRNVSRFYSQVAAVFKYTDYVFAAVLCVHLTVSLSPLSLLSLSPSPRPPSLRVLSLSVLPPAATPHSVWTIVPDKLSLSLFLSRSISADFISTRNH